MKSKILATTLVGLLFGLVACDKPQENASTGKTDSKQVEQVESKLAVMQDAKQTEKLETNVHSDVAEVDVSKEAKVKADVEVKENKAELVLEQQSMEMQKNDDELKGESFKDKSKQTKPKKVTEKSETEKVLSILEKQYQNVRCAEGHESGYCLEESQRLKSEIERLKAKLGK